MTRNSRLGSVVSGLVLLVAFACPARGQAPYRLTIKDAIQKGLEANLSVLVAGTRVQEAEGTRQRRLANLLARARGQGLATVQTVNLKTFGIDVPGLPTMVGPFSVYDFRLSVEQPLVDLQSYYGWRASGRQLQAAREDYQDVRDLIIRLVAGLYLNAQTTAARADAAESRVATADALYKLARERREAGVATGVDVLRAQVELANEQQRLLEARNAAKQALLVLARSIGLSPGTPLELAQLLQFKPVEAPEATAALSSALADRSDYLSLRTQREALAEQRKAVRARYLPRLSVSGNYGPIGRTLGDLRSTGTLQGSISVSLFDWDRQGERQEIESRLQRVEDQMADLRLGIEEELREALLNLQSASEQVSVAQQGRELAQREMELARDRFQAGVTNNIEVITAQDALSRAQENYIVAVSRHTDAKIALARALGATERIYEHYLGIQ